MCNICSLPKESTCVKLLIDFIYSFSCQLETFMFYVMHHKSQTSTYSGSCILTFLSLVLVVNMYHQVFFVIHHNGYLWKWLWVWHLSLTYVMYVFYGFVSLSVISYFFCNLWVKIAKLVLDKKLNLSANQSKKLCTLRCVVSQLWLYQNHPFVP